MDNKENVTTLVNEMEQAHRVLRTTPSEFTAQIMPWLIQRHMVVKRMQVLPESEHRPFVDLLKLVDENILRILVIPTPVHYIGSYDPHAHQKAHSSLAVFLKDLPPETIDKATIALYTGRRNDADAYYKDLLQRLELDKPAPPSTQFDDQTKPYE